MKRHADKDPAPQGNSIPVHDYQPALQSAVSWLGDRYLLAEPVRKRNDSAKPWFNESRRWHPATRH